MGLMDTFVADAKVEFKVGDLYDILRVAASNEKTAQFLKNAIECEVPYNYIREVITGKKEKKKEIDGIRIEIPSDILDAAFEAAKEAAREATAGLDLAAQGASVTVNTQINTAHNPDEGIKDCAPENVSCEECPNKEFCDERARDIAGMADEPSEDESEGGDE